MAKTLEIDTNAHNKISAGTTLTGEIQTNGDIRLDGTLNGNLKTQGKVVIGESGKVIGEIHCKNADIEGNIDGKIVVAELLSLKATSSIKGDIATSKISIEPGAKFSGNCDMAGESVYNKSNNSQPEPSSAKKATVAN